MNLSNKVLLMMSVKNSLRLLALCCLISCAGNAQVESVNQAAEQAIQTAEELADVVQERQPIMPAADRTELYLPLLEGKKIAVVANQTSVIDGVHLVDSLLSLGLDVSHAYAPEHGFRGAQGAGDHIDDERDERTGLTFYSLHGKSKKPSAASLEGIDIVLFDIQDVGARFYTYISTLHYVMEACAEAGVEMIVLDRPNPHAHALDGPIMEPEHTSFIGMHPVPILYAMTIGEYAQMINGEGWLAAGATADLTVIPLADYSHAMAYELPIAPSPNLPTYESIQLYPSLCLFEGTVVSVGRGTDYPFEIYGHPDITYGDFTFTPSPNAAARYPKLDDQLCNGYKLDADVARYIHARGEVNLTHILMAYEDLAIGDDFFRKDGFFSLLAGTETLRQQIQKGLSAEQIRESWMPGLQDFMKTREAYLMYD